MESVRDDLGEEDIEVTIEVEAVKPKAQDALIVQKMTTITPKTKSTEDVTDEVNSNESEAVVEVEGEKILKTLASYDPQKDVAVISNGEQNIMGLLDPSVDEFSYEKCKEIGVISAIRLEANKTVQSQLATKEPLNSDTTILRKNSDPFSDEQSGTHEALLEKFLKARKINKELEKKYNRVVKENKALGKKYDEIEKKNEELDASRLDITYKFDILSTSAQSFEKKAGNAEQEIALLNSDIAVLQKLNRDLQEKATSHEQITQNSGPDKSKKVKTLKDQIIVLEKKCVQLQSDAALKEKIAQSISKNNETLIKEIEKRDVAIAILENEKRESLEKIDSLQSRVNNVDAQINDLNLQIKVLENLVQIGLKEISGKSEAIENLEQALKDNSAEVDTFKKDLQAKQSSLKDRIVELSKNRLQLLSQIKELDEKTKNIETERQKWESDAKTADAELLKFKRTSEETFGIGAANRSAELDAAKIEIQVYLEERSKLQIANFTLSDQYRQLEQAKAEELKELTLELDKKNTELETAKAEWELRVQRFKQLEKNNILLNNSLEIERDNSSTTQYNLAQCSRDFQEANISLNKEIEELKKVNSSSFQTQNKKLTQANQKLTHIKNFVSSVVPKSTRAKWKFYCSLSLICALGIGSTGVFYLIKEPKILSLKGGINVSLIAAASVIFILTISLTYSALINFHKMGKFILDKISEAEIAVTTEGSLGHPQNSNFRVVT